MSQLEKKFAGDSGAIIDDDDDEDVSPHKLK